MTSDLDRASMIEAICRTACEASGITREQLVGRNLARRIVIARLAVYHLARTLENKSTYTSIGQAVGGRDHGTVIASVRSARKVLDDPSHRDHRILSAIISETSKALLQRRPARRIAPLPKVELPVAAPVARQVLLPAPQIPLPARPQRRKCLACRREFDSEGIGNRICGQCKGLKSWRTGNDYFVGGL
jgi:hypothetical protein